MDDVEGARNFKVDGDAYDRYMGRYAVLLAAPFADVAGVAPGDTAIDVGCGPGALTAELVNRLGSGAVLACDPSPSFRDACRVRHPDVDVRLGRAEALPFDDDAADHALAQLVLHFVSEPVAAAGEMARVVRPGGRVAACVWDSGEGMEMRRAYWDAARAIDPGAPDEADTMRLGRPGEIAEVFATAGLDAIEETTLTVTSTYESFDELWEGFLAGVGPAGAHCLALGEAERSRLRAELCTRLGSPTGSFTLSALARCAVGRVRG